MHQSCFLTQFPRRCEAKTPHWGALRRVFLHTVTSHGPNPLATALSAGGTKQPHTGSRVLFVQTTHHHITTSPHHHIINTRKAARAQKAAGITHPTTTTQRHTRSTWYTIQTTTTGPCLCLLTTAHRDAFQLEGAVVCTIQLQAVVPHGKLVVLDRLGARLKGLL